MNNTLTKQTKPKKKEKTSIPLTIWTKPHGIIDLIKYSAKRKEKYEIFNQLVDKFGKPSVLWVDYFLNSYSTNDTMIFLKETDSIRLFEIFYDEKTNSFNNKMFHESMKYYLKTWK